MPGAINYVRVPAGLSLLMLLVFWGTIRGKGAGTYARVSGLEYEGYVARWLLRHRGAVRGLGRALPAADAQDLMLGSLETVTSSPPTETSRASRIDGNVSRDTGRLPAA